MKRLSGASAVVVGGSSGIGAACARALAHKGVRVAVGYDAGRDRAERLAGELAGGGHCVLRLPVLDSRSLSEAAEMVEGKYGGLDIVVNSAATTTSVPHGDLDALDDVTFDRIMQVNVRGSFAIARAFVPLLRRRDGSVLVNISSTSAESGRGSNVAYCASKAALNTMSLSLARALAPAVRVLCVSPGIVDTDFVVGRDREVARASAEKTMMQHFLSADDVAESVLAAIDMRWTTGCIIKVDGGGPA